MTKRFAFTLAEVLIALAIIGVVAAITIPTFMANTAGAQFKASLKKGVTVLTQAASANYATEGYDFAGTNGYYGAPTETFSNGTVSDGAAIVGFNTASSSQEPTDDLYPDTPSLFHLFQNNLNMKNSAELTNYAVMPADVALNCAPTTDKMVVNIVGGAGKKDEDTDTYTAEGKKDLESRVSTDTTQGSGGIDNLCEGRTLAQGGFNQGRMFQLEDGMVFTYDPSQAYCTETNPCYGYIDVNGPSGPNRVISCSSSENANGTVRANENLYIPTYGRNANANLLLADCTVESKDITDIYPVLFYGTSVRPASLAAKSVLYSRKTNQTTTTTTTPTTP